MGLGSDAAHLGTYRTWLWSSLGLTAHRPICACLLCLTVVLRGFIWHLGSLSWIKVVFIPQPSLEISSSTWVGKLFLLTSGKTWGVSSTCLPKRLFGGTYNGVHRQKIFQSQIKLPSAKFHGAVCTNGPEGFLVVSRGFVVGNQAGVLWLCHTFGLPAVSGETWALIRSFSITHCSPTTDWLKNL